MKCMINERKEIIPSSGEGERVGEKCLGEKREFMSREIGEK